MENEDPRIVAAGGTRNNPKHTFDFPGMASDATWRKTDVHKTTHFYGCARCGQKFTGPHAVYVHLAKVHPKK